MSKLYIVMGYGVAGGLWCHSRWREDVTFKSATTMKKCCSRSLSIPNLYFAKCIMPIVAAEFREQV